MTTYYEYELGDGATILIEGPSSQKAAYRGLNIEDQVVKTNKNFPEAMKNARLQADILLKEIKELHVSEAEIKFSLSTTGELGLLAVAKIGVGVNYEITLRWKSMDIEKAP